RQTACQLIRNDHSPVKGRAVPPIDRVATALKCDRRIARPCWSSGGPAARGCWATAAGRLGTPPKPTRLEAAQLAPRWLDTWVADRPPNRPAIRPAARGKGRELATGGKAALTRRCDQRRLPWARTRRGDVSSGPAPARAARA